MHQEGGGLEDFWGLSLPWQSGHWESFLFPGSMEADLSIRCRLSCVRKRKVQCVVFLMYRGCNSRRITKLQTERSRSGHRSGPSHIEKETEQQVILLTSHSYTLSKLKLEPCFWGLFPKNSLPRYWRKSRREWTFTKHLPCARNHLRLCTQPTHIQRVLLMRICSVLYSLNIEMNKTDKVSSQCSHPSEGEWG